MKLGILTFHRSINYGAFMQCYALSRRLQQDFPELQVEVIDYTSPQAIRAEKKWVEGVAEPEKRRKYEARRGLFADCCSRLPLSGKRLECEDSEELFSFLNREYDVIVVGSDAVWNWNLRGLPNPYFLHGYHGGKLSYAASAHGQQFRTMTSEQKYFLGQALGDFYYLGVRDSATKEMLHMVDPMLTVHHNCDPTLFLDISGLPCDLNLVRQKFEQKGIDTSRPTVALMAGEHTAGRELKKYLGSDVQLVALYEPNCWADAYMDNLDPFEWAASFSLCRGTVTHFFHGTLLSLVNGIPPMPTEPVQGYAASYTSKIRDVLTRLELLNYYHPIPMDRFSKLRRKLGFSTDRGTWKQITADLQNVFTKKEETYAMIRQRVEREAESYQDFRAALQRCIAALRSKEK